MFSFESTCFDPIAVCRWKCAHLKGVSKQVDWKYNAQYLQNNLEMDVVKVHLHSPTILQVKVNVMHFKMKPENVELW